LLVDNYAEVCEPFVFEKVSSISDYRETVVNCQRINVETALSKLIESYIDKDKKEPPVVIKDEKEVKEPAQESQSEEESEESKEESEKEE
jgi:hypothetical protein